MRGFLASSIGVTCAAALALPLTLPAAAAPAPAPAPAPAAQPASGARSASTTADPTLPGSTESLPLAPRTRDRTLGAAPEQGLTRDDVHRFSLVGVTWSDPDTELRGQVQVRTRATGTGEWSGWQDIDTHNEDHGADPGTAERDSGHVHGSTAPLWVGDSDGVDVRVRANATATRTVENRSSPLPAGLHLELVDPGAEAPPAGARPTVNRAAAPLAAELPALSRQATEREVVALRGKAQPYIGPRPRIVTRHGWGADETLREKGFVYTKKVKAAFVHHTATGNNYRCSQAPSVIRGIYRYHVESSGWRDIGYNFLVDKCGTIYEGRAGGATKAVMGAHTLGFNTDSMGIAVLGTFGSAKPSSAAVNAIARLTAWKLGLYGVNPRGKTYLKSGGGNLYPKGKNVRLNVISGHRDGFATECPGRQLYGKLGSARSTSARFQGR
ncbi:N-acetylmuramoyl-L-alanine amidase [Streptomyces sp. MBT65]|uniref:peptidoglycan recognition protein family protein n=1 Tax=Streptomyces sp. MBT65 TaxID=1488395 RepID=UPI00190AD817|nr:N-acetylmuramoyl-L-alanine amidase [Streptomyces sp. MBT65]MBK3580499.1 N-acetylmuramoyl-L-alanine amidase [Streptomyces sp. MBT65]